MPQIVQPNVEGSSPVGGGANVGAVILDQPKFDPLQVQMAVDADLSKWRAKKDEEAALKKAEAKKLIADIDVDYKGIMPEHTDWAINKKNELIQATSKLYNLDPTNPESRPFFNDAKRIQNEFQGGVNASIEISKGLVAANSKYDPSKYKEDNFLGGTAAVRSVSDPLKAMEIYRGAEIIKPKKNGLLTLIDGATKDLKTTTEKTVIPKGGLIVEKSTEIKFPDDKIDKDEYALLLRSNPEISDAINEQMDYYIGLTKKSANQLSPSETHDYSVYKNIIDEAAKKGTDPRNIIANNALRTLNWTKTEEESKGETEYTKEMAKISGKGYQNKQNAEGVIKFLASVQAGDSGIYAKRNDPDMLGGWKGEFYGTKAIQNMALGQTIKQVPKLDRDGNMTQVDGQVISEEKMMPNIVRYFSFDPKTKSVLVATDESVESYKKGKSISPFVQVKDVAELAPTISTDFSKSDPDGFLKGWNDVIQQKKWYKRGEGDILFDPMKVNPNIKPVTGTGTRIETTQYPTGYIDSTGTVPTYKTNPPAEQKPTGDASGNLVDANGNVIKTKTVSALDLIKKVKNSGNGK